MYQEGARQPLRARPDWRRIWMRLSGGWGMPAAPPRRGPPAPVCCCPASARALSRWQRLDPGHVRAKHQSLHHVVAQADWDDAAMLAAVRAQVLPAIERHGPVCYWIIDDSGFPKQGTHSVGVARQYCGQLGKQDNCQVAVSLSVANDHASLPIAYQLFLPQVWADDPARQGGRAGGDQLRNQDR